MFQFVNWLRAIAAVLITNSHFGDVWPISQMAVGGLLGNVIFFAVSGFCLFKIKEGFGKWLLKRIVRVLPVMIAFTLLTVLFGLYPLNDWQDAFKLFVFPTNYIFLVWLMLLYPVYYAVAYFSGKYKNFLKITVIVTFVSFVVVYLFYIDKSVYSIDNVSNPFILFVYFLSMLIGGFFNKYYERFERLKPINLILLVASLVAYFGTKIVFSSVQRLVGLQIVNQFTLLIALFYTFAVFVGLERKLKNIPSTKLVGGGVNFLAKITLHVYLVQFVVLAKFSSLVFPLNLLVVTVGIVILATALYYAEYYVRKLIVHLLKGKKRKIENGQS